MKEIIFKTFDLILSISLIKQALLSFSDVRRPDLVLLDDRLPVLELSVCHDSHETNLLKT